MSALSNLDLQIQEAYYRVKINRQRVSKAASMCRLRRTKDRLAILEKAKAELKEAQSCLKKLANKALLAC
jgi:hypothetical protein